MCLRCRQEQRQLSRARRWRRLTTLGAGLFGLVAVIGLGTRVMNHWPATQQTAAVQVTLQGTANVPASPPASPPPVAPTVDRVDAPPLAFAVPEGHTTLADSMSVERSGDSVIVSFDTPGGRTRRRDKFTRVVRQTLPAVFGPRADSLLAVTSDSALVAGGDLLTELPARGVHLPLADRWALVLWPETRPGQDGPLVVRYRARVIKDGALD